MKIILLDDESLALNYLEHQLTQLPSIHIVGKYTNPIEGKAAILEQEVEVVFLDIQMPEVNGIELAEQLLEQKPALNIVFVTAYDEYAVQAFELNALDYVLKPVGLDRLRKTLQRIQGRKDRLAGQEAGPGREPEHSAADRNILNIQMFHKFSLELPDQPPLNLRWRTSRAQELFLYMLQSKGQLVRKATLIDMLWPEYELEKAYSQLYTAVYHVRKTLSKYTHYFQITNSSDGYVLHMKNVSVDVGKWERFVQAGIEINGDTIREYEEIMDLYKGDYLQEYDFWWTESERHRLKLIWLRVMLRMADWYLSSGQQERAVECYLDICQRHPLAEEAHLALMKVYASTHNHLSVHRQYRYLKTVVMEELNEQPSPYVTEWYKQWKSEHEES